MKAWFTLAGGNLDARPWLPPTLWGLLIFLLTSIPNPPDPATLPVWSDKVIHVVLYGVFGALLARGTLRTTRTRLKAFAAAMFIVALVGAVDEWHQQFVPGRLADIEDWFADVSGGLAGAVLGVAWQRQELRS